MSKVDPLYILGALTVFLLIFSFLIYCEKIQNEGLLIKTPEISTQPMKSKRLNEIRKGFANESL